MIIKGKIAETGLFLMNNPEILRELNKKSLSLGSVINVGEFPPEVYQHQFNSFSEADDYILASKKNSHVEIFFKDGEIYYDINDSILPEDHVYKNITAGFIVSDDAMYIQLISVWIYD